MLLFWQGNKEGQCDGFYNRSNVVVLTGEQRRALWRLLLSLECCCFDRGTKIILREFSNWKEFEWEIYLYDIRLFITSLIITLIFHCTLYLVQNEKSRKLGKRKVNIKCFLCCLGLDAICKCFVYFIFNILSSSYINAIVFY